MLVPSLCPDFSALSPSLGVQHPQSCPSLGMGLAVVISTLQVSDVIKGMRGGQRAEEGHTPSLSLPLHPAKPNRGSSSHMQLTGLPWDRANALCAH